MFCSLKTWDIHPNFFRPGDTDLQLVIMIIEKYARGNVKTKSFLIKDGSEVWSLSSSILIQNLI